MIMVPNHQSSTFSTWVSLLKKHIRGHMYKVCKGDNKTIQWARPLHTMINSSQTRDVEGGGPRSIMRPTSFQVVARQTHDTDKESVASTIGYADTDSIDSENSGDLVEEAMSRHLEGDCRRLHLSGNEFDYGDNSIVDEEICSPRRARSTSGTLRLHPTARILEDDERSHSTSSFLSLSPSSGSKLEASNWSTSSSVVRSPASSRLGGESGHQLTGCSSRNLRTRNPCWTDREEETIISARNYLSTRKSASESVSTKSVSICALPSPTDTYDSEESSQSSRSTVVVEEARDLFDQDLLKVNKGEAKRGIRELSQSIRTRPAVESVANSTSSVEVCTSTRGDVTTSIIGKPVSNHTTHSWTKLLRPTAPRRSTTSPFKRTANHFRMIEKAKADSELPEISKKVAQSPKLVLPPSRGRHNHQRHHWG
jgi:hypothetical protein